MRIFGDASALMCLQAGGVERTNLRIFGDASALMLTPPKVASLGREFTSSELQR